MVDEEIIENVNMHRKLVGKFIFDNEFLYKITALFFNSFFYLCYIFCRLLTLYCISIGFILSDRECNKIEQCKRCAIFVNWFWRT